MKAAKKGDRIVLGEGYLTLIVDSVRLYNKPVDAKGAQAEPLHLGNLGHLRKVRLVVEVIK
jgi:hypothetical protein